MKKTVAGIAFILMSIYAAEAWAVNTLDAKFYNRADDTPAPRFNLTIPQNITINDPWVVSDQYIRLKYASDMQVMWSIRIVTKNKISSPNMKSKILIDKGFDGQWGIAGFNDDGKGIADDDKEAGWAGSDDVISDSYGGLIDSATQKNPNNRARLAWQVFMYDDPNKNTNSVHDDGMCGYFPPYNVPNGKKLPNPGPLNDNTIDAWKDWAFLCDVDDTGFIKKPDDDYFKLVLMGGEGWSILAGQPQIFWQDNDFNEIPDLDGNGAPIGLPKTGVDINTGQGDIAIYIGACFGKNQDFDNPQPLTAGNYTTVIYIELFHE